MFRRMGLSNRLNIIVISVNIIILAVAAMLANASSASALRNQAIERFTSKNTEVTERLNMVLSDISAINQNLSTSLAEVADISDSNLLRSHILTQLSDVENRGLIFRINVLRPDQSVAVLLFEAPAIYTNYQWRIFDFDNIPSQAIIQNVLETRTITWFQEAKTYFDPMQRPTISLAQPFIHEQGNGVIWLDIAQPDLGNFVTAELNNKGILSDTEHGYAILADQNNHYLTLHNLAPMSNTQDIVQAIFERSASVAPDVSHLYRIADPLNNENMGLFSIERLSSTHWHLVTVLPENEIPALPNNVFAPIILVAMAGLMVLVITVNRFIERSVVQPLVDLGRSATEIGEGNLRFIVFHKDKPDEIGNLANALDSMRSRLKESYDELQTWGRTLEQRVTERTEQLAIAQKRAEDNAIQLRAVYDESLSVVNETQLGPVIDAFIERILLLFNATYCAIWLITSERQSIQLVATNDTRRNQGESIVTVKVGDGLIGQVIAQNEPIIVDDYASYEHRILIKNDDKLPFVRGVCAPLMFAGQAVGAVVVGRPENADKFTVSDQRYLALFANLVSPSVRNAQLLVQLQAAVDEAHRANEVKTRFLASVTHELRTPLNLIINNMDFMRVGAFGDVSDEQINRLNQTVRSAEHLLYLINDLLDVSKIEAGEMQLFIQTSEVQTLLEDSIDNAQALLDTYEGKEDVYLNIEVEADLPELPMDARRIRQVLNNLLSNAIKFTQSGVVTLKVFQVDDGVHFSVHDTGMGIPKSEMDLLFAAFERTTQAKQQAIEGTGLGLPISRYLVQQHGSDLTVVSEEGMGSTFAFTLPFVTPEAVARFRPSDTQQITAILSSRNP